MDCAPEPQRGFILPETLIQNDTASANPGAQLNPTPDSTRVEIPSGTHNIIVIWCDGDSGNPGDRTDSLRSKWATRSEKPHRFNLAKWRIVRYLKSDNFSAIGHFENRVSGELVSPISLNRRLSRGPAVTKAAVTSRPHERRLFSEIGKTSSPPTRVFEMDYCTAPE